MRIRKVRRYGNTLVIVLSKVDAIDMHIEEGDEFDIEGILLYKKQPIKTKKEKVN